MNLQNLISDYTAYNLWANQQFINWLSNKPVEQLNQEVPSSFSSILKTLNHIWAIEEYWYSIIAKKAEFNNRYGATEFVADEIFEGLINRSTLLAEDVKQFTDIELTEKIKLVSPWLEADQPRYEYLLQLVNHGTYHRGQIITIARNVGITDAPNTDYIFFSASKAQ